MISQRTARETKRVIGEWAKENNVIPGTVVDLLQRIGKVPGNQSFKDLVQGLLKLFESELTGRVP